MSTYEEFMVLLTFAILIVTILEYVNHKKIAPPLLQSKGAIFHQHFRRKRIGVSYRIGCLVKHIIHDL